MKTITLQIDEKILGDTDDILSKKNTNRDDYICKALKAYNSKQQRKQLQEQLKKESKLVSEESISVLKEFEAIE